MNPPYIDIHTHDCTPENDVIKVCVHRLGHDFTLPEGDFTAGVHPWDVGVSDFPVLDFFDDPPARLIGVGETGLDFTIDNTDRKLQIQWLNKQLHIAERLKLPVVLHCVKAYNEIQMQLKNFHLKAVVFHGFIGSPELAQQLVRQGYNLSFGGRSMRSPKTTEALKIIPPEHLFLETDDDPQTDIYTLYKWAADVRKISEQGLKETIFTNYKRIFNG